MRFLLLLHNKVADAMKNLISLLLNNEAVQFTFYFTQISFCDK